MLDCLWQVLILFRLHFAVFYLLMLNIIMQILDVASSFEVLALSLRPISSKVLVLVLVLYSNFLKVLILVLVLVFVTEVRVNITAKTILRKRSRK